MSILSTYRRLEYKKPTMCPTSGKGVSTQAKMGKYVNDSRRITMAGDTTEEGGRREGEEGKEDRKWRRNRKRRSERCMWSLMRETHIIMCIAYLC